MSYGLKYELDYCDDTGSPLRLEILQKDYTGTASSVVGSGGVVEIRYQQDDVADEISASTATIFLIERNDFSYEDIYTGDERTFQVKVYNSSGLIWSGWILPDQVDSEYKIDGIISIVAIDGLGTLKNVGFVDSSGDIFRGRMTLFDVVSKCLEKTDLGLNISVLCDYNCEEWTAPTPGNANNILASTWVHADRFSDKEGNVISCYEVLKMTMPMLGATLRQENGKWSIFNIRQRVLNTGNVIIYTPEGVTLSPVENYTITIGGVNRGALAIKGMTERIDPVSYNTEIFSEHGPYLELVKNTAFKDYYLGQYANWTNVNGYSLTNNATVVDRYNQDGTIYSAKTVAEPSPRVNSGVILNTITQLGGIKILDVDNSSYMKSDPFPILQSEQITFRIDLLGFPEDKAFFVIKLGDYYLTPERTWSKGEDYYKPSFYFEIPDKVARPGAVLPYAAQQSFEIKSAEAPISIEDAEIRIYGHEKGGDSSKFEMRILKMEVVKESPNVKISSGVIYSVVNAGNYSFVPDRKVTLFGDYIISGVPYYKNVTGVRPPRGGSFANVGQLLSSFLENADGEYLESWSRHGIVESAPLNMIAARDYALIRAKNTKTFQGNVRQSEYDISNIFKFDCNQGLFLAIGSSINLGKLTIDGQWASINLTVVNTDESIYSSFDDSGSKGTSVSIGRGDYGSGSAPGVTETDPTVPRHVKEITSEDIDGWDAAKEDAHTHQNKALLDSLSENEGYLLVDGENIKSGYSDEAGHADEADHAQSAETAKEAEHAIDADVAQEALHALDSDHALTSDHALEADHALDADHADEADYALDSDKWDGKQFDDYLDQPVRVNDDVRHKSVSSPSFVSGFAGSGFRLNEDGLTVDNLTVRKLMSVYELVINQIRATNGSLWVADSAKINGIGMSGSNYVCTIDTDNNRIAVPFATNDVVRCQKWDGRNIAYYVGVVSAISAGQFTLTIIDGAGIPAIGDDLVRIGNTSNVNRQGALYLTSSDNNAPYLDVVDGVVDEDLSGKTKVRLGRLTGIVDPDLGTLSGYGLYAENAYIRGQIHVIGGNAETKQGAQDKADQAEANATAIAQSAADAAAQANNYINNVLPDELDAINAALDGLLEQYFETYDPSETNAPADSWTTTQLKEDHLGDLFYNTQSGKSWRWVKEGGVYMWKEIVNSDLQAALQAAANAQDTADSKRRIFTTTPFTPYDIGDLWVQGSTGDIMRCATAKTAAQSYAAADWVKASKYTDDTRAVQAENNAKDYTDGIKAGLDQDIEDLTTEVEDLDTYIDGSFRDGIIQENEAIAIKKYINTILSQSQDLEGRYDSIYNNPFLAGTDKTFLLSRKNNYDTYIDNLLTIINNVIADGKTTPAEVAQVDTAFGYYIDALNQYATALDRAVNNITNNIADQIATDKADAAEARAIQEASQDAQNKADEARQDAIDASELLIQSIKTGTVNLLSHSNIPCERPDTSTAYNFGQYDVAGEPLETGQEYTLVLKGTNVGPGTLGVWIVGSQSIDSSLISDEEDVIKVRTFIPSGASNQSNIRFYHYPSGTEGYSRVEWACIFKGNVQGTSDWSPNPQDVNDLIQNAQDAADDANQAYTDLTNSLKGLAYQDIVELADLGNTVIDNGKIVTTLLDAAYIRSNIINAAYINSLEIEASKLKVGSQATSYVDNAKADAINQSNQYTDDEVGELRTEVNTQFNVIEGLIEGTVTQSEFDALDTRVSNAEGQLTIQAGQIAQKAESSTVTALGTRTTQVESDIDAIEGQLTLKVSQEDFDTLLTDSAMNGDWKSHTFTVPGDPDQRNWFRIALNNGNRANARFIVYTTAGGQHSTIVFYAGSMYGHVDLNLISYSNYNTNNPFSAARIITKSTYDEVYLELELRSQANVVVWAKENITGTKWQPINFTPGEIPSGYNVHEYPMDENHLANSTQQNTSKDTSAVDGVPSSQVISRITNAESEINLLPGKLELKANVTTVDALTTRTTTAEQNIDALEGEISLNVSRMDYMQASGLNLINNPTRSGNTDKWEASAAVDELSIVTEDFNGQDAKVLKVTATGNGQLRSDYFDIDPSKAYQFSVWVKKPSTSRRLYFGFYTKDSGNNVIVNRSLSDATGAVGAESTNIYFMNTISALTDWIEYTAYILPAGFPTGEPVRIAENANANALINPNSVQAMMRIYNYTSSTTQMVQGDLFIANPRVVEVDVNALAKLKTSQASIIANADAISLRVEKSGVISSINQSAEAIKISASKIDIEGAVTFSSFNPALQSDFNNVVSTANTAEGKADAAQSTANQAKNTADGTKQLTDGWTMPGTTLIDGGMIQTGTIVALGAVTAGSFNLGSGKFKVAPDGTLEAEDAVLRGTIFASAGEIGGWIISGDQLSSEGGPYDANSDFAAMNPGQLIFRHIEENSSRMIELLFGYAGLGAYDGLRLSNTVYRQLGSSINRTLRLEASGASTNLAIDIVSGGIRVAGSNGRTQDQDIGGGYYMRFREGIYLGTYAY